MKTFRRTKTQPETPAALAAAAPLPTTLVEVNRDDIEIATGYVQTVVRQTFEQSGRLLPIALALVPGPLHTPEVPQLYTFTIQPITSCPADLLAEGVRGFQAAVGAVATVTATLAQQGDKTMMVVVAVDTRELRAWGAPVIDGRMEPFVEVPDFAVQLQQVLNPNA